MSKNKIKQDILNNFHNYRKGLCEEGRVLFDDLPQIPGSFRQFDKDPNEYEPYQEEKEYQDHISQCSVCKKVLEENI